MSFLSSKPGRLTFSNLFKEVQRRILSDQADSFVCIVPNRVVQRGLERHVLEESHGKTISRSNILTLSDFAGLLCKQAYPQLRLVSDAVCGVFIEEAIRELLQNGALTYFERPRAMDRDQPNGSFPLPRGTFELVVNTIRQLKESGITARQLKQDLDSARKRDGDSTEVRRASDIHKVYESYEARLEVGFVDEYGQTLRLLERYADSHHHGQLARQDMRAALPGVRDIFIEGFTRLEPPTLRLLSHLASVEEVQVVVSFDAHEENPELFSSMLDLRSNLLEAGFAVARAPFEPAAADRGTIAVFREHVARTLFKSEGDRDIDALPTDCVTISSADSPYEEVESIARTVKQLFDEDGEVRRDLSRVVIATPFVDRYTPIVHEIFARHEIPAFVADRFHLDRSQFMMGLLALLDIARLGIRRRDVLRALASPYFRYRLSETEVLDAQNILEVVSRYRLTGNVTSWQQSLRGEIMRVEREMADDATQGDTVAQDRHRLAYARLLKAESDLAELERVVAPFRAPLRPQEFCKLIRNLLTRLEVGKQLLTGNEYSIATRTLQIDTRGYRAFVQLIEELESLFLLMGINSNRYKLEYYVERLKAAAIWTRFAPRPKSGAVLVTSLEQAVGQSADHLFIAGLVESELPRAYEPQVFLMGNAQRGEHRQLAEERLLFYQGVTGFRKRLFLSYPKKSLGGAEQNPSSFLQSLSDVIRMVQPTAEAAPRESIYSYRDLYHFAAGALRNDSVENLQTTLLGESTLATSPYAQTIRMHTPRAWDAQSARTRELPTVFRGSIDAHILTASEQERLEQFRTKVWSVTQLEMYASCAFKFYADQILQLDRVEELEEGMEARDQGSLLHEVLRQFMTSRRDRNLPALQDVSAELAVEAFAEMQDIAEKHLGRQQNDHPFWRLDAERLLGDTTRRDGVLWKFIQRERELVNVLPRPKFFEVSFGGSTGSVSESDVALTSLESVDLEGIRLRGKIDRIDIADDHFTLVDYKSGKTVAKRKDIERGVSLQLPLYLRVAERLLTQHLGELRGVAAIYHKVADPQSKRELGLAVKSFLKTSFDDISERASGLVQSTEELDALIRESIEKAKRYVDGVARGEFPLVEKDLMRQCDYCDYRHACRVKEAEDLGLLRQAPPDVFSSM